MIRNNIFRFVISFAGGAIHAPSSQRYFVVPVAVNDACTSQTCRYLRYFFDTNPVYFLYDTYSHTSVPTAV